MLTVWEQTYTTGTSIGTNADLPVLQRCFVSCQVGLKLMLLHYLAKLKTLKMYLFLVNVSR